MTSLRKVCSILFVVFILQQGSFAASQHDEIQLLIQQNRFKDALILTEEHLRKNNEDIKLLFLKGLIHTRMDDLDSAEKVFLGLTNSHPELPEPYNNLAVVYAAKGDFDKAEDALKRAINTHPSYATAKENLGDIYAKMASLAYNQALQLDEDNITAREKLSMINNLFSVEVSEDQVIASLKKQKQEDLLKAEKARKELRKIEQEIIDAENKANQVREQTKKSKDDLDSIENKRIEVARKFKSEQSNAEQDLIQAREKLEKARQELARVKQEKQKLAEVSRKAELQKAKKAQNELNSAREKLAKARQELASLEKEKQKLAKLSRQEELQKAEKARNELNSTREKLENARQELASVEKEKQRLAELSKQEARKIEAAQAELDKVVAGDDIASQRDVISMMESWVKSWSEQDVDQYLSFYAQDFSTPNGLPRKSWEEYRRQRLLKPRFIQVDIQDPKISIMRQERARVKFVQRYQSNTYSDRVTKIVLLKRENNRWLITEEKSGN